MWNVHRSPSISTFTGSSSTLSDCEDGEVNVCATSPWASFDGEDVSTDAPVTNSSCNAGKVFLGCARPYLIRNTFIETVEDGEAVLDSRKVRSAPGSVCGETGSEGVDSDDDDPLSMSAETTCASQEDREEMDAVPMSAATALSLARAPWRRGASLSRHPLQQEPASSIPLASVAERKNVAVIRIADALNIPKLGLAAADIPTEGSALHSQAQCKPCVFFWKPEGCESGRNCQFCHLCDPGEKKRRQKERLLTKRNLFKLRHALANGGIEPSNSHTVLEDQQTCMGGLVTAQQAERFLSVHPRVAMVWSDI